MDAKKLIEIVQDVSSWKGDVYKFAYEIAECQKEADAQLAEDAGQTELAALIRAI